MKDLRVHAILFALAIIAALLTWNRDITSDEDEMFIRIWDRDSADVRLVHYQTPELDLRIERRTDAAGDYLWGTQIGGMDGPDTLDFPIGAAGAGLVGRIARLRTLREMGELSPELMNELGIEGSASRLRVRFTDEERELILGDSVFGLPDQYALEAATGLGYVLSREVMRPLANGEGNVRERWVNHFAPTEVAQVRVEVAGRVRTMSPARGGEWTEVGGGAPDLAFATFMQRVDQLAIEGFRVRPAPETVTVLMRAEYFGEGGGSLGFVELMRDDSGDNPYFLRSGTTRIPAQAVEFLAQRVEEVLDGVVSGAGPGRSSSATRSSG